MTSYVSMISFVLWDDQTKGSGNFSTAEEGVVEQGFFTIAVNNSDIRFAIYDSTYASRMPIVISAGLPLRVLGCQYRMEEKNKLSRKLLGTFRRVF